MCNFLRDKAGLDNLLKNHSLKVKFLGGEETDFSQRLTYSISLNETTFLIHQMMLPDTLNNTI